MKLLNSIARINVQLYKMRFNIENENYLDNIAEAQTFDIKRTKYDYVQFQGEVPEDNNNIFATKLNNKEASREQRVPKCFTLKNGFFDPQQASSCFYQFAVSKFASCSQNSLVVHIYSKTQYH